ncbi:MFS transporter [Actinocatenispora thailandica]|uniref:MFS transporter n=1 Tax=Actinocatenispora thailandica TaxID=227318 RepID=A0A7R7HWA6_9ACTN|nr:MFS transporter [Actinocatenispora thailandica]BCJ33938.1 MFS transporter [Actinocatenispora thailandica]
MRRQHGLGEDFRRLWAGYTVSAAGSAVGSGALPLIALLALHASTFQVSLLAGLSAVASAAIALPLGVRIEYRRKRPVMMSADVLRFAVLASVPAAAALGVLTYPQLCVVGVVQTAASVAFNAASGAHLKALVEPAGRIRANSAFETTNWVSSSAGPPLGGLLIGVLGTTATMAVDAMSFLGSVAGIHRIRRPEPTPPARTDPPHLWRDVTAGWRHLLARRGLRVLFVNSLLFGGPVMMASPLMAVLMLRNLGLAPWQYGLALGLPCLGGVLGSHLTPALTRRLGPRRTLLLSGAGRAPWLLLLPLTPAGALGVGAIVAIDFGLLFAAGVFNPSFSTYRMDATDDAFMSRVVTSWSISSRVVQALFMLAGGVIADLLGVRPALAIAGTLCLASAFLLPWRHRRSAAVPAPRAEPAAVAPRPETAAPD